MSLRAAIQPFRDEDGLIIERPNQSDGPETGNGIRERCALELLCYKLGETNRDQLNDFRYTIQSCEAWNRSSVTRAQIRGIYNRGPRKTEEKAAHDDRRCLSAVSSVLNLPFARDIYRYGKDNWWSFNNLKPNTFSLSDCDRRFAGVVPMYRLNAGSILWPFEDVELAAAILVSAFKRNPGQKVIWWMQVEALEQRGIFGDVTEQWWNCVKVQYGSMREVFSAYYQNPNHPFALLSPV